MLTTALVLFAIAALGGLVLFSLRLMEKPLPLGLAVIHGLVAAAGLVVLIAAKVKGDVSGTKPTTALVLFVVAALGGFVLFAMAHLKKRVLPIPFIVVHAAIAVIAFVILLLQAFSPSGAA